MVSTQEIELPKEKATTTCLQCKREFQYPVIRFLGKPVFVPNLCSECVPPTQEPPKMKSRLSPPTWDQICPAIYRQTDIQQLRLPPDIIEQVLAWEVSPIGIGLSGPSGIGKTRLMFLLLRKLHDAGHNVIAISGKKFEQMCHRMFEKDDDARLRMERAKSAAVLFIDDIGKERYTERVESEFYDLVESRTSDEKPILWTTNATGDRLAEMLGEDRGTPIVRRLREFSIVLSL